MRDPDKKSINVQGREKKGLQILLSYSQAEKLSRARKKYLATTYQPFFSALYIEEAKFKKASSNSVRGNVSKLKW